MRALPLILLLAAAGAAGDVEFDDAERAALDACDRLGLTEVADRPLVAVTEVFYVGEDGPVTGRTVGFVLSEDGDRVWISDFAYLTRRLTRTETPDEAGEATLAPITPEEAVSAILEPEKREWFDFDSPGEADARSSRLVFAARLRSLGRPDLARRLLDTLEPWEDRRGVEVARELLAERLAWRRVLEFEDLGLGRADILKRLKAWLECFPETRHAGLMKELAGELERMVKEDAEHAVRCPGPAGTGEARIADLVWHLRDARGGQFMQPGSPSVFSTPGRERNAAHELRDLGWPAIPALIAAIDDTRTTRTVGYWRNFCFSHYVVRVGDAAYDVLTDIVGQGFWQGTYTAASIVKDGDAPATKARIEEWWKQYGPDGEVRFLRDRFRAATGWARTSALRKLLERSPPDAAEAVREEVELAGTPEERLQAVGDLAELPGEEATAALRRLLGTGADLAVQVRAACALAHRDEPGIAETFPLLWAKLRSAGAEAAEGDLRSVARHLAAQDDEARAALVRAAREDPARLAAPVRSALVGRALDVQAPPLTGAARDFAADAFLEALAVPPLARLLGDRDRGGMGPGQAAAGLDRLRGGGGWDGKAPPAVRLEREAALVRAERADRGLPPPPEGKLLLGGEPGPGASPTTVVAVRLAAGCEFDAPGETMDVLRELVGREPDVEAVERVLHGALRHRPRGAGGVMLRLRRTDGPIVAEVAWFATEREGVQIDVKVGDGDGWSCSTGSSGPGDEPVTDVEFSPWIRDEIGKRLRRAANGNWVLDVYLGHG